MSKPGPTDAQAELPDLPPAEARRQIALLQAEVTRLSTLFNRQVAELDACQARNRELEAGFTIALGERDKILASQTWRATRTVQRVIGAPRRVLSPLMSFAGRRPAPASDLTPAPEAIEPSAADQYERWVTAYDTLSPDDRSLIAARIDAFAETPVISLVIADEGADDALLQSTIASIRNQLYPAWEVCLGETPRVAGGFVARIEPGDLLPDHALYEIAAEIQARPDAAMIYADEDRIDGAGRRSDPAFKPAFSIELQLGADLTSGLTVYRRTVLEAIGLPPGSIGREPPQLLAVRVALDFGAARIRHIPAILCHRRVDEAATDDRLETCIGLAAIARRLGKIQIAPMPGHAAWNIVTWPLPDPLPRVSVIIPTRDRAELLMRAVTGLLYRTDYPNLEVLILDNDSVDACTLSLFQLLQTDPRVRVVRIPGPFNYSALNNAGVRVATGDVLLLLNNDVDVTGSGWLKEMVSHVVRPEVGAVGAKLLYADGRIQHGGVVLGVGTHDGGAGVAGHFGHFAERGDDGYLGQFALTREVSAVTGACLAVRREVFEAVGGLDETALPVSFNDVDFCLRLRECGYRIIWTPLAELYHLESASRGQAETPEQVARAAREATYMRQRWGTVLDTDPFYNPNFDRKNHTFALAAPPNRERPWRSRG